MSASDFLTEQEYKFVNLLLDGYSIAEASEAVNICRRSGYLWKEKPHIKAALEAGQHGRSKIMEEVKSQQIRPLLPEISEKLRRAVPKAIDQLIYLTENGNGATMVAACKEILRLAGITETITKTDIKEDPPKPQSKGLSAAQAADIRAKILGVKPNK